MSGDNEEGVDADSPEFKQGVNAGLNSEEETTNWKAGNDLGRELKAEGETKGAAYSYGNREPQPPLFMRSSELQGADQDEKDGTAE